jgi:hypothetical protein
MNPIILSLREMALKQVERASKLEQTLQNRQRRIN